MSLRKIFNKSIQLNFTKENITLLINYLMVLYAFFILISHHIAQSIIFIIIILYFFSGNIKEKLIFALKDKVVQSLLLFFLIHISWLSFVEINNIQIAIEKIKEIKLLLYIIIFITIIKKEFVYKIISAFLYSVFLSEMTSYAIFFKLIKPIGVATVINPVPFTIGHSFYTVFLVLALGLIILKLIQNQFPNKFLKYIHILFFFTITTNIFMISSRTGYLLFTVIIIALLVYNYKRKVYKYLLPVTILIVGMYFIGYNNIENFRNRVNQTILSSQKVLYNHDYTTSLGIRVGLEKYALEVLAEHPIVGVGIGSHLSSVKEKILSSDNKNNKNILHVFDAGNGIGLHNEYLDIAVQFGLIGLLIYLNIYYQILRYKQKNIFLKNLQIILVVVFMIHSIPDGTLYMGTMNMLFVLLLATTLHLYDYNKKMSIHAI